MSAFASLQDFSTAKYRSWEIDDVVYDVFSNKYKILCCYRHLLINYMVIGTYAVERSLKRIYRNFSLYVGDLHT